MSRLREVQKLTRRCYLTDSYKLTTEWSDRLKNPLLQKVSIENMYFQCDSKFNQTKKISPVDVDIYANKIDDDRHMEEIADLMMKLRMTEEASNVFDSSQHALIRNYIDNDNFEALVHVLNNRTTFGVYLDNFAANILLDKLIQEKQFKLAARFTTIFALQEEFSNPITTSMSLYSCYMFLNQLEPFDDLAEKPVEQKAIEGAPKKKKIEEVKVRVKYVRNPYFDDHFDVKNSNHLLGKTFLLLSDEVQNDTLANSLKLLGYSLYEKFEEGNKFLAQSRGSFFKETVEIVKSFAEKVESLEGNEPAKLYFDSVGLLSSLKDEKVGELIENLMKQAVQQQAGKDIDEQKKIYASWLTEREEKLNTEIARHNRIQRLLNIEKLQEDQQKEEKKLWFFEKEDKVDLEIEGKRVYYPKRWFGKKKTPRAVDEGYIPPDVDKRRNVK